MRFVLLSLCAVLLVDRVAAEDEGRVFANWKECFRFMVGGEMGSADNDAALFKLAAESSAERFWLDEGGKQVVIVVQLDSWRGAYSEIRGAQNNGPYFLFVPVTDGYELVGQMEGNHYTWGTMNGHARFITGWHMSANQSYENIYDWDGKVFRQTSHILYEYDGDGNRREITDTGSATGEKSLRESQPTP